MLAELLQRNKTEILESWRRRILETYPADSSHFLGGQKDQFLNPVGHAVRQGVEDLFEGLLGDASDEKLREVLDSIIRIRSVQDFGPAEAVGFIFLAKAAVREHLEAAVLEAGLEKQLWSFESRVDRLALLAFEVYMLCREKLFEIKLRSHVSGPFPIHQRTKQKDKGQQKNSPADGTDGCDAAGCDSGANDQIQDNTDNDR